MSEKFHGPGIPAAPKAPASQLLRIRTTPANKDGSLPAHWDILPPRGDDSLVTVWTSFADAEYLARCLDRLLGAGGAR